MEDRVWDTPCHTAYRKHPETLKPPLIPQSSGSRCGVPAPPDTGSRPARCCSAASPLPQAPAAQAALLMVAQLPHACH
eukprot:1798057-Rhodomonas_salina.2